MSWANMQHRIFEWRWGRTCSAVATAGGSRRRNVQRRQGWARQAVYVPATTGFRMLKVTVGSVVTGLLLEVLQNEGPRRRVRVGTKVLKFTHGICRLVGQPKMPRHLRQRAHSSQHLGFWPGCQAAHSGPSPSVTRFTTRYLCLGT